MKKNGKFVILLRNKINGYLFTFPVKWSIFLPGGIFEGCRALEIAVVEGMLSLSSLP